MPKNIEDIIPGGGKRSIRNIPIPVRKIEKIERLRVEESVKEAPVQREMPVRETQKKHNGKNKRYMAIGVGLAMVIFALLAVFDGATLSYVPKTQTINFNNDALTAETSATGDNTAFSLIKISGEKSVTAKASGEETVSDRAGGTVVIYNEQSTSQTLVNTTRLETPDGKIFRIQREIVIPAKGSVEVAALADVPGPSHNIGLTDFTIPGLKGTPRYTAVYARSKTAMTGGFTGTRKKVSEADLTQAKTSLESLLKTELIGQARAQMPQDFVLFTELSQITYEVMPIEAAGNDGAKITVRGHLDATIFKKTDLSNSLISKKLGTTTPSVIEDFSTLNITFSPTLQAVNLANAQVLPLQVSGAAKIKFITDEANLASDLAGVKRSGVDAILAKYPSIESASVTIRPFWERAFPNEVAKIKIEATDGR